MMVLFMTTSETQNGNDWIVTMENQRRTAGGDLSDKTLSLDTKDSIIERFCAVLASSLLDEIDGIIRKF